MAGGMEATVHNQFEDLVITDIPRKTIHLDWRDLRVLATDLLTGLLKRDISLGIERCEYYYWSMCFDDDSLSLAELETLFAAVNTDEEDRLCNDSDDDFVDSLSQGLSHKLISLLLPFQTEESHADDYGVWFISKFVHGGEEAAS